MTTTDRQNLDRSISAATQALLDCQRPDGEWCFELEADATIPSEYILFRHFLGEPVDSGMEGKIAVYLRRTQSALHGGWPLVSVALGPNCEAREMRGMARGIIAIGDVAVGEVTWALMRGTLYSTGFVVVMVVFGLVASPWAILTLPARLLRGPGSMSRRP